MISTFRRSTWIHFFIVEKYFFSCLAHAWSSWVGEQDKLLTCGNASTKHGIASKPVPCLHCHIFFNCSIKKRLMKKNIMCVLCMSFKLSFKLYKFIYIYLFYWNYKFFRSYNIQLGLYRVSGSGSGRTLTKNRISG